MTIQAIWEVTLRGESVGAYLTCDQAKLAAEAHAAWSPEMHWDAGSTFTTPAASLGLNFEVTLRMVKLVPLT